MERADGDLRAPAPRNRPGVTAPGSRRCARGSTHLVSATGSDLVSATGSASAKRSVVGRSPSDGQMMGMSAARLGANEPRRILVLGAGVIGSVYADKLLQAGHHVVLLARGRRLTELQTRGLVLENSESKQRSELPIPVVDS